MSPDFGDPESFRDAIRSIAREIGESIERLAGEVDVEEAAGQVGVDPARARDWLESTANWLGSQLEHFGDEMASRASQPPSTARSRPAPAPTEDDPLRGAAPHPLDFPTDEQGLALAALDSGRWSVEPGSNRLVGEGDGRPPSDALGIVNELRARDWITPDGRLTLAGTRALARWLDSSR